MNYRGYQWSRLFDILKIIHNPSEMNRFKDWILNYCVNLILLQRLTSLLWINLKQASLWSILSFCIFYLSSTFPDPPWPNQTIHSYPFFLSVLPLYAFFGSPHPQQIKVMWQTKGSVHFLKCCNMHCTTYLRGNLKTK